MEKNLESQVNSYYKVNAQILPDFGHFLFEYFLTFNISGRNLGVMITPDFFVISRSKAEWVECKTEKDLEKLAQKSPHRYLRREDNKWESPPGVEYAQQFGFGFQLWSSAEINWTLQRNLEILERFITEEYENKKQKSKRSVYASFVHTCAQCGINDAQIPSYRTFITEINKRSKYSQIIKRSGSRAAYEIETGYWELELTTSRHGDFPFHIAHIDHTELDIELRCSKTGKVLGKPWLSLLVDAFTRRILAIYISYDPPSYRSCMMVLRICVQRHSRLPQIIVTDNGKEFYSTYFETLLAMFECTLKRRPPAKPRFGGVCERLFGTANTQFLYNLTGNTQITKKVRLMTKSVNPKNLSIWKLSHSFS